jgi:ADP-heptose:LPS heptosyltransferase
MVAPVADRRLQISDPRERRLVRLADLALAPMTWVARDVPRRPIRRVLLLRLERIGDLLMVLDAIRDARRAWPDAEIDLAVGSWNRQIAVLIPDVTNVVVADPPWLARGAPADSWPLLIAKARAWRRRQYDIVLNFEPDIRSNLLAWLSRAPERYGYSTGGGGRLLTSAAAYVPTSHVSVNARQLVARAAGRIEDAAGHASTCPRLDVPAEAQARARQLVGHLPRPLVGVHASGGRESTKCDRSWMASVSSTSVERSTL